MTRSIFAIEMCLRYEPSFVSGLADLLRADTAEPSAGQLWEMFTRTANAVMERPQLWHLGCWDFWDDAAKAQSDFQMWKEGLMTEEGARKVPSAEGEPYRGGERYLTVTMACLMLRGTDSERRLAEACNIPEAYLWQHRTFERILRAVRHINFAVVDRSTLYLIPQEDGWALTPEDLRDPKFHYFRPIV
ncbi:MAG: hypothetical protein IPK82_33115 [Polyangiaceae bacterium]|nr:hypothetical protein [Polyangiaceae bacterium]